jgi:hypothetical protein
MTVDEFGGWIQAYGIPVAQIPFKFNEEKNAWSVLFSELNEREEVVPIRLEHFVRVSARNGFISRYWTEPIIENGVTVDGVFYITKK